MTKEEREDAINFFKEVAKREVGVYCELAIEALESKEKSEYDHDVMKAYNNGQTYILDILRKELELIGANEQETNGKTDYLKGITTCLDIIGKYREGFILPLPESEDTNGSVFLKTYLDSRLSNVAYDDGICYVYVDFGGSRTRFTSDWWNALYKVDKEEQE